MLLKGTIPPDFDSLKEVLTESSDVDPHAFYTVLDPNPPFCDPDPDQDL